VIDHPPKKRTDELISILRYRTNAPAARSKITLQQNLITFLLDGEKTVHFAGTQVSVKPHQFVLLAAGNCLMSEKIAQKNKDYHSILIFFDNNLLQDFFDRHATLLGKKALPPGHQPFLLLEKDDFLVNFTHSLDSMLNVGKPIYHELEKLKLEELFLYLAMQYPGQLAQIRNMSYETDDDWAIRQAVTSHVSSNVTVEELAFLCNMSLSTFKRRFAKLYGTSPNKWLLEMKMQKAAQLLRRGEHKVSEIYFELGYENLSSFIQSFKQVHGITPKQYQLSN
jgi:AraC-like DNA-binding protein